MVLWHHNSFRAIFSSLSSKQMPAYEAVYSYEMLVPTYQRTRCHNPEDHNIHQQIEQIVNLCGI